DRGIGYDPRQVLHLLDVLAVKLDHDVTGFNARGLCRALVINARDQRAVWRLDVKAVADLVGDLLDLDAEPAAPRLAELAELIDHPGHGLRRHRKADADRAARWRDDRRVDADDLAVEIEQRTTGVAAIDRGVGLDVIIIRPRIDIAVTGRDDAGGHGAAETKRVADRDHPLAEPQRVGVAELHGDQRLVRLEAQQREIRAFVAADDLSLVLAAVVQNDVDLVGVGDHVVVGDDQPRRVDDEAGTERVDLARLQTAAVAALTLPAVLEEVLEELLEWRAGR